MSNWAGNKGEWMGAVCSKNTEKNKSLTNETGRTFLASHILLCLFPKKCVSVSVSVCVCACVCVCWGGGAYLCTAGAPTHLSSSLSLSFSVEMEDSPLPLFSLYCFLSITLLSPFTHLPSPFYLYYPPSPFPLVVVNGTGIQRGI